MSFKLMKYNLGITIRKILIKIFGTRIKPIEYIDDYDIEFLIDQIARIYQVPKDYLSGDKKS